MSRWDTAPLDGGISWSDQEADAMQRAEEDAEPPEEFRDLRVEDYSRLCGCGLVWSQHFDGWDGHRLSCREGNRRSGRGEASEAAR